MGVKGLWTLVEPCARPVRLETLSGKRVAVDASIWLYQFIKSMRDKDGKAINGSHILGFFRRICKLLFFGIKPIFVFDGGAPELKKITLQGRRKRKNASDVSAKKAAALLAAAKVKIAALNEIEREKKNKKNGGPGSSNINVSSDAITALQSNVKYYGDTEELDDDEEEERQPTPKAAHVTSDTEQASDDERTNVQREIVDLLAGAKHPHHKKRKRGGQGDEYELPEMPDLQSVTVASHDPRLVTEAEMRDFISEHKKTVDLKDVDIDSIQFQSLPLEIQHEIIVGLKTKSRQASAARLDEMQRNAKTSLDFSKMQIRNLVNRNTLTQRYYDFTKGSGKPGSAEQGEAKDGQRKGRKAIPQRIASERQREFFLVKNNDADGGGYTLKTAQSQKVVDNNRIVPTSSPTQSDKPKKAPVIVIDEDSEFETDDSDDDEFEEVKIDQEALAAASTLIDDDDKHDKDIEAALSNSMEVEPASRDSDSPLSIDAGNYVSDDQSIAEVMSRFQALEDEAVNQTDNNSGNKNDKAASSSATQEDIMTTLAFMSAPELLFNFSQSNPVDTDTTEYTPARMKEVLEVWHLEQVDDELTSVVKRREKMPEASKGSPRDVEMRGFQKFLEVARAWKLAHPAEEATADTIGDAAASTGEAPVTPAAASQVPASTSPYFNAAKPTIPSQSSSQTPKTPQKQVKRSNLKSHHTSIKSSQQKISFPSLRSTTTNKTNSSNNSQTGKTSSPDSSPSKILVLGQGGKLVAQPLVESGPVFGDTWSDSDDDELDIALNKKFLADVVPASTGRRESDEDLVMSQYLERGSSIAVSNRSGSSVKSSNGTVIKSKVERKSGLAFVDEDEDEDMDDGVNSSQVKDVEDVEPIDMMGDDFMRVDDVDQHADSYGKQEDVVAMTEEYPNHNMQDDEDTEDVWFEDNFTAARIPDDKPEMADEPEVKRPRLQFNDYDDDVVMISRDKAPSVAPSSPVTPHDDFRDAKIPPQPEIDDSPSPSAIPMNPPSGVLRIRDEDDEPDEADTSDMEEDAMEEVDDDENATARRLDVPISTEHETDDFAQFVSSIGQRDVIEVREELEQELTTLNQAKRKAERDAAEINEMMTSDAQELLRLFGIPYIVAPLEAESQCADLYIRGLVDGIVTEDSDVFLFGGSNIYKNMFNQTKYVETYSINDIETSMRLTREDLIKIAYLLGSDYTEGIPGVGTVTAMEILNEFPGEDGLADFREWWAEVVSTDDRGRNQPTPFKRKFAKKCKKIDLPGSFPEPRVREAYLHPPVHEDDTPFVFGIIDHIGLRKFFKEHVSWESDKTDSVLVPVIKQIQKVRTEGAQTMLHRFFPLQDKDPSTVTHKSGRINKVLDSMRGSAGGDGSKKKKGGGSTTTKRKGGGSSKSSPVKGGKTQTKAGIIAKTSSARSNASDGNSKPTKASNTKTSKRVVREDSGTSSSDSDFE
ncbi:hypothetical protein SmJEL517_g02584 [Synchytrium microbalum]|uniref:DNA excision repair protein ERCC-5 n=1 Tax=Synchytrium microbalum TaxID=1806994 RepID=A0A507C5S1_9FUNG|nr:uncharacterized protein SmJEL517_g02584 [Synchytrium microbalum]TPX34851.1 hypothetical protein SmJEL517_g02584 [Synchytrium microbalum]